MLSNIARDDWDLLSSRFKIRRIQALVEQHCTLTGTKETVYLWKGFKSHRHRLGHRDERKGGWALVKRRARLSNKRWPHHFIFAHSLFGLRVLRSVLQTKESNHSCQSEQGKNVTKSQSELTVKTSKLQQPKARENVNDQSQCCSVAFDVWWGGTEFPFRITPGA